MTKFSVEEVSPIERKISVEVEPEMVSSEMLRAYKELNLRVRIPGFRPGKAPRRMLEARYKHELEADVIQHLVEHSYEEAIRKSPELHPVSSPRVTNEELKPGEPFRYQARVEVKPKIEPKEYEGLEMKKVSAEVPESNVDQEIERLREATSEMLPVEGRDIAQDGDFASVAFEGTSEGKQIPGGKGETLVEVAAGEFPDGKLGALKGVKVGAEIEIDHTFPADYRTPELAGKTAHFKITLKDLRTKKLPALDDQLAKNVGAGETLADLRKRIRGEMEHQAKNKADAQKHEELVKGLIAHNPLEVPSAMVDQAIRNRLQSMLERLQMQGIDPRRMKLDFDRMAESMRASATEEVKGALLLDAVATKEKIEASDADVDAKIKELAEQLKAPEETIRQQIAGRAMSGIRAQIREEKTLAFLESKAKITEP